jgi:general secretion pathway protein D
MKCRGMRLLTLIALTSSQSAMAEKIQPELFPVKISTYSAISPVSTPMISTVPVLVSSISAQGVAPSTAPVVALAPAPSVAASPPALETSKPLSLDFREMDIVDVLKTLSRQNGLNIIIGKNVSGKVTAFLNNVDFWEGFRTILKTRDLAYVKQGDLIEVMTSADYERIYGGPFWKETEMRVIPFTHIKANQAKDALEPLKSKVGTVAVDEETNSLLIEDAPENIKKMKDMIAQLDTPQDYRVFRLNYASAEDILPKIAPMVSKDYGNIQVDKRSNTVVVQDNPARVREIGDVIRAFDTRHKAVLIEAKILQITLNKSFQWGINWQGVNWTALFDKFNAAYHLTGGVVQNLQRVDPNTVKGPNVTAPGITASVGVVESPNFQAIINFLDTVGTTNLLSSPRVMALNNQEARIHVGDKVAKITKTLINAGSTTTSPITTETVEFLDVGVKLAVTPTIGDDNTITMKVKPEVSSVENTITTSDGSSIPVIRVSEAEASLVVKDGITVVMGGLMEDNRAKTDSGVPILRSIPLIGYLFRSRSTSRQKTELVIFLTPHIVTGETVSLEAQKQFDLEPTGTPKKRGFWRRLFGKAQPNA